MGKIHVLDKAVAELIAAGEVVERPSSIVKELVENAVDAGARNITVEIRGGGIGYLRVSDDGSGIDAEDIPRAFIRHATSKVQTADDLLAIGTLGFRGEALASIAAMCRVELTTRTEDAPEGTIYRVEGGETLGGSPAGCPKGTTVVVRDVFFNTPARMKFLKRDVSEGNSVAQVVDKCALSHPEVAFRLIRDDKTRLRTSGRGDALSVIRAIYGKEISDEMIPVDYNYDGKIRVQGFISKPSGSKPSRVYQNFFINGRYVRTRTGSAALEEAFKQKLMKGKYPACTLYLTIDEGTVDVNVHPAKIEVRFVEEKPVFHAVYFAVKSALGVTAAPLEPSEEAAPSRQPLFQEKPRRSGTITPLTLHLSQETPVQQRMTSQEFRAVFSQGGEPVSGESVPSAPPRHAARNLDISVSEAVKPVFSAEGISRNDAIQQKGNKIFQKSEGISTKEATINKKEEFHTRQEQIVSDPSPSHKSREEVTQAADQEPSEEAGFPEDIRLIGEVFSAYILMEQGDDLLLVDKHAAHERVLYERLRENLSYGNSQLLLAPLSVSLAREDYGAVVENTDRYGELGFEVDDFGDSAVLVRSTPIELPPSDIEDVIREIADKLRGGNRDLTPEALDRLYYSIACRSAIKAGDKNNAPELDAIVEMLRQNPQITHCPHGRPVLKRIPKRDLEKLFRRIV